MTQLSEMFSEFEPYLNLSVSLLHFFFQHPKVAESILPCIFHNFLLEKYFSYCNMKKIVTGAIDIKDESGDHLPLTCYTIR